jgi:adenylosuccinate synthase
MVDVLLGLQWGDEGKGKVVDYLAEKYDVVARFQGGPNAGHTLILNGKKHVLHTIPSGVFRPGVINIIGNGVVIDPITLKREMGNLIDAGVNFKDNLYISKKAHLILPSHRMLDAAMEASKGDGKIGSTLRGIGPTYTDKIARRGLRIGDVFDANFAKRYEELKAVHLEMASIYPKIDFNFEEEDAKFMDSVQFVKEYKFVEGEYFINKLLDEGKSVLAEGAQGSMLDIDFGTYPFVTSSNTITAGVCNGLGVAPSRVGEVIGITKAYCTRVGGGPFPTELLDEMGETLRKAGSEFGATTGRPRRCGWIDLPQLRYTIMLNGVTQLVMTKVDVLNDFDELSAATSYTYSDGKVSEEVPYDMVNTAIKPNFKTYKGWQKNLDGISDFDQFPEELKAYVLDMEAYLKVPFTMISIGPERESLILR